jgi:hypothetical protein
VISASIFDWISSVGRLGLQCRLQLARADVDRRLLVVGHLLALLLDQLLGLVGELLGAVAQFDGLPLLAVLLGVRLGVLDHAVDLVRRGRCRR